MSQSEHFLFANETEIEDIGGGLKRQMLGYNHELMAVKIISTLITATSDCIFGRHIGYNYVVK